jgi:hypothetical protein
MKRLLGRVVGVGVFVGIVLYWWFFVTRVYLFSGFSVSSWGSLVVRVLLVGIMFSVGLFVTLLGVVFALALLSGIRFLRFGVRRVFSSMCWLLLLFERVL